jgi:ethanolamine utilization protein EutN
MLLGRVIGTVVPCVVYQGLEGVPMLLLQPLDRKGAPEGRALVAADATRMAGPGELVYYEGGREAAMALDPWFVPVDHAIIGIVDEFHRAGDAGPAGSGRQGER